MRSLWDSLEAMSAVNQWAKWIGGVLGLIAALCGFMALISGFRTETLRGIRNADRHLTAEQKRLLTESLKDKPRGQLVIVPVGTTEARTFAKEFVQVFENAGWQVSLNDRTVFVAPPTGLELWLHSDRDLPEGVVQTGEGPLRTLSIQEAFKAANLSLQISFSVDVKQDELRLVTGLKP